MKKESAHIDYSQEFHGKAESRQNYRKESPYRYSGVQKKIIIRNLKHLKNPKIRAEKRVTLAKFRSFVVPKYQYYCMYQDPSEEDIKPSK